MTTAGQMDKKGWLESKDSGKMFNNLMDIHYKRKIPPKSNWHILAYYCPPWIRRKVRLFAEEVSCIDCRKNYLEAYRGLMLWADSVSKCENCSTYQIKADLLRHLFGNNPFVRKFKNE